MKKRKTHKPEVPSLVALIRRPVSERLKEGWSIMEGIRS